MSGWARSQIDAAADQVRAVLHHDLTGLTVTELDGILVESDLLAHRLAELARQIADALDRQADDPTLRLDAHGEAKYEDPAVAVGYASYHARAAATALGTGGDMLHHARQATATIGQRFDEE